MRAIMLMLGIAKSLLGATVSDCRVEYKSYPLNVDNLTPRFSWVIESDARGILQDGYEIQVGEGHGQWFQRGGSLEFRFS